MSKAFHYAIFFLSCFSALLSNAQDNPDLRPVLDTERNIDTSQYTAATFLPEDVLTGKQVVGLGESTHGTSEFFSIKDYIIRNQVLHGNAKLIAMETGFCGLLALNRYMLDNGRPIDSLLNELDASGMYGIYYTREVYRMLLWLKAYNMSRAENRDKIQLFGIDMQDPYSITGELLKRLPELPSANTIIYQRLTELHKLYYPRKEVKMPKVDRGTYERLADDLGSIIREKANLKDTTLLLHLATLLKQTLELRDILARSLERGKVRNQQYMEARDKFMAGNVIWTKENYSSPDAKLMLWAHNGHIAHASLAKARRMGYYLKEHYGNSYYAMDFVFGEGSVRMYDRVSKKYKSFYYPSSTFKRSVEYPLKDSHSNSFFINFSENRNPGLTRFFDKYPYQRVIGTDHQNDPRKDYFQMPVRDCFDGLLFVKKAHAAENIERNKRH